MEAMACGCPVLVSSLACFRDFLTDRHNGMVFSLDGPTPVQSLADNLRILLSDQALSARLSSQAAQDLRLFDNTSVAERFLSFYSSLLDAPPITHAHTLA